MHLTKTRFQHNYNKLLKNFMSFSNCIFKTFLIKQIISCCSNINSSATIKISPFIYILQLKDISNSTKKKKKW